MNFYIPVAIGHGHGFVQHYLWLVCLQTLYVRMSFRCRLCDTNNLESKKSVTRYAKSNGENLHNCTNISPCANSKSYVLFLKCYCDWFHGSDIFIPSFARIWLCRWSQWSSRQWWSCVAGKCTLSPLPQGGGVMFWSVFVCLYVSRYRLFRVVVDRGSLNGWLLSAE